MAYGSALRIDAVLHVSEHDHAANMDISNQFLVLPELLRSNVDRLAIARHDNQLGDFVMKVEPL